VRFRRSIDLDECGSFESGEQGDLVDILANGTRVIRLVRRHPEMEPFYDNCLQLNPHNPDLELILECLEVRHPTADAWRPFVVVEWKQTQGLLALIEHREIDPVPVAGTSVHNAVENQPLPGR
jgi:hypothetical protein